MPTIRYHLNEDKEPAVEIELNPLWKDMAIRANGELVGSIASREQFQAGCRFDLPSGKTLRVQLPKGTFVAPVVTLDGQTLYPLAQSPGARLGRACLAIFLCGGIYCYVGARRLLEGITLDLLPPESWIALGLGGLLLVLGVLARLRFLSALLAALTLLVLLVGWGFLNTAMRAPEHGVPLLYCVGLIIQLGLLLSVYQGIAAVRELNNQKAMRQKEVTL